MSLPLVNLISMSLSAVSLIIFFAALRKASNLTAMSRLMANQIASSASNLQKALAILQSEREICRDESVRLEARLKDSDRVRSEIARAMDLVKRARLDLKPETSPASTPNVSPLRMTPVLVAANEPQRVEHTRSPSSEPARAMPVFVNRIVRAADVAGVLL
jgi:hypothetical protein